MDGGKITDWPCSAYCDRNEKKTKLSSNVPAAPPTVVRFHRLAEAIRIVYILKPRLWPLTAIARNVVLQFTKRSGARRVPLVPAQRSSILYKCFYRRIDSHSRLGPHNRPSGLPNCFKPHANARMLATSVSSLPPDPGLFYGILLCPPVHAVSCDLVIVEPPTPLQNLDHSDWYSAISWACGRAYTTSQ